MLINIQGSFVISPSYAIHPSVPVLKDLIFPSLWFKFCLSPLHFNTVYETVYIKLPVDKAGVVVEVPLKQLKASSSWLVEDRNTGCNWWGLRGGKEVGYGSTLTQEDWGERESLLLFEDQGWGFSSYTLLIRICWISSEIKRTFPSFTVFKNLVELCVHVCTKIPWKDLQKCFVLECIAWNVMVSWTFLKLEDRNQLSHAKIWLIVSSIHLST